MDNEIVPQEEREVKCSYDGCEEPVFRYGLCFGHFADEEMRLWEDDRETKICVLESMR